MIDLYQFDNANAEGDKEAVVFPNQPTLINKLSANEANRIKDKLNEIIEAIPDGVADTVVAYPILALRFKGEGNTLPTIQVGDRVQGMADSETLWLDATYNGGDVTNRSNYTVNSSGSVGSGDIKPRLISVSYPSDNTLANFATRINAKPQFTILNGQLPVFYLYHTILGPSIGSDYLPSYRLFLKDKGAGTYGVGGEVLTASDLIIISETKASIDEIESMQGTKIIDLGEIGTANVWDFLNAKDPFIAIQDILEGYRVVKTLVSGVSVRYLFLGVGGNYGVGQLQSVQADFDIQSGEIPDSGGGLEPSVIFPDTEIYYTGSKSFTIEEGVKVLTFKKNGSGISINWTQVGNIITYNGLEDLNTDDYFIYNGIKAVSIVEVSGNVPDATTTIKGKLKLAGDLAGTADAPTVPALANIYTKTEVDAKVSSVYVVKESVATLAALNALTGQVVGWVRNVNDSGMNYVYTASGWDALGSTVDISGKEDKSNKISAITGASTDKYTSEKAVVDYVAAKVTNSILLYDASPLSIPHTGTTARTRVKTWTIPANKIKTNCLLRVTLKGIRVSGTSNFGIYTPISATATNGFYNISSGNGYLNPFLRHVKVANNKLKYFGVSGSYPTDFGVNAGPESEVDFNPITTDLQIHLEYQLTNASDVLDVDYLMIEMLG